MNERRAFLKLGFAAIAGAIVAPLQALAGEKVTKESVAKGARLSLAEDKVVRAIFDEGWNAGNKRVFASLVTEKAADGGCPRYYRRYREAFPDLKITIQSMQKEGDQVLVRWSAQGTHKGVLDGLAPTGKQASTQGTTMMKIVNGKVVSSNTSFEEGALKEQLGAQAG